MVSHHHGHKLAQTQGERAQTLPLNGKSTKITLEGSVQSTTRFRGGPFPWPIPVAHPPWSSPWPIPRGHPRGPFLWSSPWPIPCGHPRGPSPVVIPVAHSRGPFLWSSPVAHPPRSSPWPIPRGHPRGPSPWPIPRGHPRGPSPVVISVAHSRGHHSGSIPCDWLRLVMWF